jgi:hypothetical protein
MLVVPQWTTPFVAVLIFGMIPACISTLTFLTATNEGLADSRRKRRCADDARFILVAGDWILARHPDELLPGAAALELMAGSGSASA